MLLLLLACQRDKTPVESPPRESTPVQLDCADSWEKFAQPLVFTWCAGCHSSRLEGEARYGAPEGVDLETLAGVREHAALAQARVNAGTMPPGGGLPAEDIERLNAWFDCGMAGEEAELAAITTTWSNREALQLNERSDTSTEPGADLSVSSSAEDWGGGIWSIEHWAQDETGAALVARERYDEEQNLLYYDVWDPPLRVWDPTLIGGAQQLTRTRWSADGSSESLEQTWTLSVEGPVDPDPLSLSHEAWRVEALEADGESVGMYVDSSLGMVMRWYEGGALEDPEAARVEIMSIGGGDLQVAQGIPFHEEVGWGARNILSLH